MLMVHLEAQYLYLALCEAKLLELTGTNEIEFLIYHRILHISLLVCVFLKTFLVLCSSLNVNFFMTCSCNMQDVYVHV